MRMGFLRHECKITVIDKKCFTDYQEQYLADPKSGPCPFFNVGDAFLLKRTPQQDDFYPLMLVNRAICGFLGSNSAILRSSAVQRYIPERLRSRVNALSSVLLTTGASVFSLLMGFLGEVLDYRWCVTFGGAATLLACRFLIGGRRQDARKVYEAG